MEMRNILMTAAMTALLGGMPVTGRAADDSADGQEAYRTAKQPLVEALLRFERDYNDGANGPLRPMSGEAWDNLLEAVAAAAEAKDVTDTYEGFAGAASALTVALDAAEQSISLHALQTRLATALRALDAASFATVTDAAAAEESKATDEALRTSVREMDAAFRAYALRQETPMNTGKFLGENLDFEAGQGVQDARFPSVFVQPGWDTQFSGSATDDNLQYTHLERLAYGETARPSGLLSDHYLYLRSRWMTQDGTVRVMKETALPSGTYVLTFYLKTNHSAAKENLCFFTVNGVQRKLTATGTWRKRTYTLTVDEPSLFTLSFGFIGGNGDKNVEVWIDDIELQLKEAHKDNEGTGIIRPIDGGASLTVFAEGKQLWVEASADTRCVIHTIDGVQVGRENLKAGETRAWQLPAGIYIVNGSKVVLP